MTEHAVIFAAQSLVGVLTDAEVEDIPRRPATVFLNAGMVHHVGPNRLHVRMARELARCGFASLRFDCSGIGDSPHRIDGLPLHAAALGDVRDALDFVAAERGASSFILVGFCSGADLAFRAALADERVVGAVLIDGLPYHTVWSRLHHFVHYVWSRLTWRGIWKRLFAFDGPVRRRLRRSRQPERSATISQWRNVPPRHEAELALRKLTARGVRFILLFTPSREYSYRRQFRDMFPSVRADHVDVVYFRDADHTFTLLANQDLLVRTVVEWISRFR